MALFWCARLTVGELEQLGPVGTREAEGEEGVDAEGEEGVDANRSLPPTLERTLRDECAPTGQGAAPALPQGAARSPAVPRSLADALLRVDQPRRRGLA